MTESDIRRIMVALGKIEVSVEALREENLFGQRQHEDYELRLRHLEQEPRANPTDVEARLRGLERVRWIIYGACSVGGAFAGAGLTELLGG